MRLLNDLDSRLVICCLDHVGICRWGISWKDQQMSPLIVHVYRMPDGSTQVRAPEINDPDLVIDMLNEAIRAMTEGIRITVN